MNKKIIFRADGNAVIGLGHLYRIIAVIEMLKNDYDFILATKSTSALAIIPNNFNVKLIPDTLDIVSEPDWLKQHFSPTEYIIFADGYQFNAKYQKELKAYKYQLIYIDDLVEKGMCADVVINHAPLVKPSNYYASEVSFFGLGTKYALLRPSFLKSTSQHRKINEVDTAFVCFGGADKLNLSLKITLALLDTSFTKEIHIVLGQAYMHDELLDFKNNTNKKITVHQNLSEVELVDVMSSCNFAIVPTSTIFYELCCVRMPVLGGYFVENQKQIYDAMAQEQVILEAGDFSQYTVAGFKDLIDRKFKNIDAQAYVKRQSAIFDGKSNRRILGLVNALNIGFREANMSDLERTFEWSNDEVVRKNSYNSAAITLDDHSKWFSQKIASAKTLFLIVLVNEHPAGIVRFEQEGTQAVVGILIAEKYRGQSLADQILRKSADVYFSKYTAPIRAYIKKTNQASLKSFEKAGFSLLKEEEIQGHDSYVYNLDQVK